MAIDPTLVAFLLDQMSGAGIVSAKPMIGEYGFSCGDKMVAMACDSRLYVRPTAGGSVFASEAEETSPYLDAKPYLLIDADHWDDCDWLGELIRRNAGEMPLPRTRAKLASRRV